MITAAQMWNKTDRSRFPSVKPLLSPLSILGHSSTFQVPLCSQRRSRPVASKGEEVSSTEDSQLLCLCPPLLALSLEGTTDGLPYPRGPHPQIQPSKGLEQPAGGSWYPRGAVPGTTPADTQGPLCLSQGLASAIQLLFSTLSYFFFNILLFKHFSEF